MNTLDIKDGKDIGIFALFKGPSGSGKTVGALSFPGVWMADLDRKMPAIARKHFPKKSIDYETFDSCFKLADQFSLWISGQTCPYETLLIDSITSLVSLIMQSIAEVKGESTPKLLQVLQRTQAGKAMVELMGIDYYNAETRYIEWLLQAAKILYSRPGNPKNIIFTAHILTVDTAPDIKTKVITRTRSIVTAGRKVAAYVPTQFDEVWLFGTEQTGGLSASDPVKNKHKILTITNGEDDAKTAFRIANETDFTDSNLYDKIISQIQGSEMFL